MEAEGVIKFHLHWRPGPAANALEIAELEAWRRRFRALGVLGQEPDSYGGVGFGNLSRRNGAGFWITATQSGALPELGPGGYSRVESWNLATNAVWATGPARPSSEAMSHAAAYDRRPEASWVFHVHAPELWRAAPRLGLPATAADIAYGTPAMAEAVAELVAGAALPCILQMRGHEDGILAIGSSAESTGRALLRAMAEAAAEIPHQPSRALRR
ncbi:class II aldolase/adducin family protein [Acidithiobacillus caldus]